MDAAKTEPGAAASAAAETQTSTQEIEGAKTEAAECAESSAKTESVEPSEDAAQTGNAPEKQVDAGGGVSAEAAASAPVNFAEKYAKEMGLRGDGCGRGFDLAEAAVARDLPDDACEEGETTGFKFPSYEDFLREEEAEQEKEEGAQDDSHLDGAFAAFMDELERIPKTNAKTRQKAAAAALEGKTASEAAAAKTAQVVLAPFGDSASEAVRLTSQVFVSPFEVLRLAPDASEEDIRRQYRKLSLLIHPDKCKHENAQEAFQVVNKAYEQLQEDSYRARYDGVIEAAKKQVLKQRVKENKARRAGALSCERVFTAGQELLPETLDALRGLVFETCEKMLKEQEERKSYAEKCRAANEKYEREKEDQLIEEEKQKCRERNEWVKKQDERVDSWREYQKVLREKEFDHKAFTGVRHVREERRDDDIVKKRRQVQGIDESYKLNWR